MASEIISHTPSVSEVTPLQTRPATVSRDLRIAPPSPNSLNGYHETLGKLLTRSSSLPEITNVRTQNSHVVVVMPVYDPSRADVRGLSLESLAMQPNADQHHLVVANNAQDPDKHAQLEQEVREKASRLGLPVTIVDATPRDDSQKNAAHARNLALGHIQQLGEQDAAFRGPAFLMDDDTATLPGAIDELRKTLYQHTDAAAVTADIIHVPELTRDVIKEHIDSLAHNVDLQRDEHSLPSLWTSGGKIDMGAIVAFSSSVAGKTTGLLMDPGHMRSIINDAGDLYVRMPNGSAEDMVASTAFGRRGLIYRNPNAKVLDEARSTPGQTRLQQHNWGRDHVILQRDVAALKLAQRGIQVLEPEGDSWFSWTVPGSEKYIGSVINPAEVAVAVDLLRAAIRLEPSAFTDQTERIRQGTQNVLNVLKFIEDGRHLAERVQRTELPRPDSENPRGGPDARVGRLAGNIMGMNDVQKKNLGPHHIPRVFVFGHRQAGTWDS